jgi:hypothetical protein
MDLAINSGDGRDRSALLEYDQNTPIFFGSCRAHS